MASLLPLKGTLGLRRASHLLRRTTFRYTKARIDEFAGLTVQQAIPLLLNPAPLQLTEPVYDDAATTDIENIKWVTAIPPLPINTPAPEFVLQRFVMGWWLNEALYDPGIGHKMQFFFHQYFALTANTIRSNHFYDYLALLRWGSIRNFKRLAAKMITDNCMLRYLDNEVNTAANPNENFAREFLELFTIGKGPQVGQGDYTHYTEEDIVQAARVLTGFRVRVNRDRIDPETGIPRGDLDGNLNRHDSGNKTFSSKFQNRVITGRNTTKGVWKEVYEFVDMVFEQKETARNLCRRLYRYFVGPNISAEIELEIIEPLADILIDNDYEIAPVLTKLLQSVHFYDLDDDKATDERVGAIIKSPLELSLQALSFFQVPIPDPLANPTRHYNVFWNQAVLDRLLSLAGMTFMMPSDVAGYPAYHQSPDFSHQWFNSSTIIARYKLGDILLTGTRQIGAGPNTSIGTRLDAALWVRNGGVSSDPSDPYVLVGDLLEYLLPEAPSDERFDYFYQTIFLDNLPPADWTYEWQNYLSTNNAQEVNIALGRLIKAILYSPEYQVL